MISVICLALGPVMMGLEMEAIQACQACQACQAQALPRTQGGAEAH